MMDAEQKKKVAGRLRRIAGQVEGIQRMIEDDRYCVDILLQIDAVRSALGKVGELVLDQHVRTCVAEAMESGEAAERDEKIAELMEVFGRYARIGSR